MTLRVRKHRLPSSVAPCPGERVRPTTSMIGIVRLRQFVFRVDDASPWLVSPSLSQAQPTNVRNVSGSGPSRSGSLWFVTARSGR